MAALVIAEHDNHTLKAGTLNTISAAAQCGGEVAVLIAGSGCTAAAQAAGAVNASLNLSKASRTRIDVGPPREEWPQSTRAKRGTRWPEALTMVSVNMAAGRTHSPPAP